MPLGEKVPFAKMHGVKDRVHTSTSDPELEDLWDGLACLPEQQQEPVLDALIRYLPGRGEPRATQERLRTLYWQVTGQQLSLSADRRVDRYARRDDPWNRRRGW